METIPEVVPDYSQIDSEVRYEVFNSCHERGLRGEALEAEFRHQLRSLLPKPLAEAAIGNHTQVISTSEIVVSDSDGTSTPKRTIITTQDKS